MYAPIVKLFKMKLNVIFVFFPMIGLIKSEILDEIRTNVDKVPELRHFNTSTELAISILDVVRTSIGVGCELWNTFLGEKLN